MGPAISNSHSRVALMKKEGNPATRVRNKKTHSCWTISPNSEVESSYTLAFSCKPSPPAPLPKGEGRVRLIFWFSLLMGEGTQRAGEGGSFAVRDIFFIPATSEFGISGTTSTKLSRSNQMIPGSVTILVTARRCAQMGAWSKGLRRSDDAVGSTI